LIVAVRWFSQSVGGVEAVGLGVPVGVLETVGLGVLVGVAEAVRLGSLLGVGAAASAFVLGGNTAAPIETTAGAASVIRPAITMAAAG
jgi:hypothetical protein